MGDLSEASVFWPETTKESRVRDVITMIDKDGRRIASKYIIQLLELRTENYQLGDRCKQFERELLGVRSENQELEREVQRVNKALSKSKKAKEVELLIQENEGLQRKVLSQEDDFRLQNETLMQELGRLVSENESLEKLVKESAEKEGHETPADGQDDELRRLQAQNAALQKRLAGCESQHEAEVSHLQQTISNLQQTCNRLSAARAPPVGENQSDLGENDSFEEDITDNTDITDNITINKDTAVYSVTPSIIQPQLSTSADSSQQLRELRLSLETEREEKELLKQSLQNMQTGSRDQIQVLQEELDKMTEKFKKKQESFVHLQEEKELAYLKMSEKIQKLEDSKEQEVGRLMTRSSSLQSDLTKCSQTLEEVRSTSEHRTHELQTQVSNLQQKLKMLEEQELKSHDRIRELEELLVSLEDEVDEAGLEHSQALMDQLSLLKRDNKDLSRLNEELKKRVEELGYQIQEGDAALQAQRQESDAIKCDRDKQLEALSDLNKVAEKRKTLLDELAIKYQTATDQHREQTKSLEEGHKAEMELMSEQIGELQKKLRKLRDIESKLEETKNQMSSLDNTKSWLERTLRDTDEALERSRQDLEEKLTEIEVQHQTEKSELEKQHQETIGSLNNSHQNSIQELEIEIEKQKDEKGSIQEEMVSLKQEIKDYENDKKLHERKGMTVVKDLKKQLQAERRRAERLQERLQEYLQSDSRSRTSVEELMRPADVERMYGDSSSVGSWSTGGLSRENHIQTPEDESASVSLEQEHTDLVKRIADLQTEKWTLEEKLSHLEESNSSMCEDLLSKTAIIEHYVMSSRAGNVSQSSAQDKLTLKHVIDFVKNKGDEDLREMNRKLQAILEETLTKNMHLEKDMESLSQELVRLSKQVTSVQAGAAPSK